MFVGTHIGTAFGDIRINLNQLFHARTQVQKITDEIGGEMREVRTTFRDWVQTGAIGFGLFAAAGIQAATRIERITGLTEQLAGSSLRAAEAQRMIGQRAEENTQPFLSMLESANTLLPAIRGTNTELEKVISLSERLALIDPVQGVRGAGIALRDFISGQYLPLSYRFELNRGRLQGILDNADGDVAAAVEGLSKYLDSLGVTEEAVKELGNTGQRVFASMKDEIDQSLGTAMEPIMQSFLIPLARGFTDLLQGLRETNPELVRMIGWLTTITGLLMALDRLQIMHFGTAMVGISGLLQRLPGVGAAGMAATQMAGNMGMSGGMMMLASVGTPIALFIAGLAAAVTALNAYNQVLDAGRQEELQPFIDALTGLRERMDAIALPEEPEFDRGLGNRFYAQQQAFQGQQAAVAAREADAVRGEALAQLAPFYERLSRDISDFEIGAMSQAGGITPDMERMLMEQWNRNMESGQQGLTPEQIQSIIPPDALEQAWRTLEAPRDIDYQVISEAVATIAQASDVISQASAIMAGNEKFTTNPMFAPPPPGTPSDRGGGVYDEFGILTTVASRSVEDWIAMFQQMGIDADEMDSSLEGASRSYRMAVDKFQLLADAAQDIQPEDFTTKTTYSEGIRDLVAGRQEQEQTALDFWANEDALNAQQQRQDDRETAVRALQDAQSLANFQRQLADKRIQGLKQEEEQLKTIAALSTGQDAERVKKLQEFNLQAQRDAEDHAKRISEIIRDALLAIQDAVLTRNASAAQKAVRDAQDSIRKEEDQYSTKDRRRREDFDKEMAVLKEQNDARIAEAVAKLEQMRKDREWAEAEAIAERAREQQQAQELEALNDMFDRKEREAAFNARLADLRDKLQSIADSKFWILQLSNQWSKFIQDSLVALSQGRGKLAYLLGGDTSGSKITAPAEMTSSWGALGISLPGGTGTGTAFSPYNVSNGSYSTQSYNAPVTVDMSGSKFVTPAGTPQEYAVEVTKAVKKQVADALAYGGRVSRSRTSATPTDL